MATYADRTDLKYQVVWTPQVGPQTFLLECPVFEVLYGGARGGGKTDAMLGDWVSHAQIYGEYAIGLVVRRERTQLVEMIERSKTLYTPLGAVWREKDNMWRFPNGARLRFAYLENDTDAEAYQGHNYTRVYVEELTNFPNPGPILKLMATLRSAAGVPCGFRATANPGGPGHLWVKQRYITVGPPYRITRQEFKNPWTGETVTRERCFIPAKVTDNRYLNNPEYIATLQLAANDNEKLLKAWLLGDWDIIDGAFFDEWSNAKHVIKQFIIPDHWPRFMSLDWGSAHPFSVGWWAVVPDEFDGLGERGRILQPHGRFIDPRYAYRNDLPTGALVRYREWYGSANHNNIGLKLHAEVVADGISEREMREPKNDNGRARIGLRVADPSAFKEDGGPSIIERMGKAPNHLMFVRADNTRIGRKGAMGGWDLVRSRLVGLEDRPMIYFFDNCVDAIRTLPAVQHDPDNIEDVLKGGEDHPPDEIRYMCMSRPWQRPEFAAGPDRIMAVGPQNEMRISDLDELGESDKPPKFRRMA